MKSRLRGALRGAAAPLSLPALTKDLGLEGPLAGGGSGTKSVLSDLVSELIAEGAVRGTAKGGSAASWVPAIHAETQQVCGVCSYQLLCMARLGYFSTGGGDPALCWGLIRGGGFRPLHGW